MESDEEAEFDTRNHTRKVIEVSHVTDSGNETIHVARNVSVFCLCVFLMCDMIHVCNVILFKPIIFFRTSITDTT